MATTPATGAPRTTHGTSRPSAAGAASAGAGARTRAGGEEGGCPSESRCPAPRVPSNTPTQHNSPATPHPSGFPPGVRPSPLTDNIATWEYELAELRAWLIAQPGSCFEDLTLEKLENETAFILEGLRHGFIVADTFPLPYEESYPVSAENETIITADLAEERSSGRIFPALSNVRRIYIY